MFKPTVQLYVLVELELPVDATTVVCLDIWLELAQTQTMECQVLLVGLVLLEVDLVVDLPLVVDLLADLAQLLVTR